MFGNISPPAVKTRKSGKRLALVCLVLLLLSGCGGDDPPPADASEPPPHDGVFRGDCGTMAFNGDGERVTVQFEDNFARQAELPLGECQGTYVFTFSHGQYRYDRAERFCIRIDGVDYSFQNDWQETNENVICLASPLKAGERLRFEKTAAPDE